MLAKLARILLEYLIVLVLCIGLMEWEHHLTLDKSEVAE